MTNPREEGRKVVVVLSSGRSGTSLLMQILGALGMELSESLIGPHQDNPDGFFEDAEIVALHKKLSEDLGVKPIYPLPNDWLSSDAVKPYFGEARAIVEKNLARSSGIWGFKDPRSASFLPLWLKVFKSTWAIPSFVLAVREPGAAIHSIIKQLGVSSDLAELIWLFRTCNALHHCGGNCIVVHYEDWFSVPQRTAAELAAFIGLSPVSDLAPEGLIKPNLNRSVHENFKVNNSLVLKLYDILKDCRGGNFDRDRLMACVRECRAAMDDFRGWSSAASALANTTGGGDRDQRVVRLRKELRARDELIEKMKSDHDAELRNRDESVALHKKQSRSMAGDLEALTLQNNAYLKQIKRLHERCEGLSSRGHSQPQGSGRQGRAGGVRVVPSASVGPSAAARNPAARAKPVQQLPSDTGPGRVTRLWRKFKRDPHRYFLDSKSTVLRPLRHLFRVRK